MTGRHGITMMLEAKYKAVRRKIAAIGVSGTAKLIIDHLLGRVLHREHLLFYVDIPTYSISPDQLSKDVVVKQIKCGDDLNSGEVSSIRDYAGGKYVEEVKTRLAKNWILFLAYIDDNVAGGGWVIDHNSEFRTKAVPLFETDIVLLDYFTFPQFRGRNVYPFLLSSIITHFQRKNLMRAFIYVNKRNAASIKGIQKAGFRHFINYESYSFRGNEIVVWKGALKNERTN